MFVGSRWGSSARMKGCIAAPRVGKDRVACDSACILLST